MMEEAEGPDVEVAPVDFMAEVDRIYSLKGMPNHEMSVDTISTSVRAILVKLYFAQDLLSDVVFFYCSIRTIMGLAQEVFKGSVPLSISYIGGLVDSSGNFDFCEPLLGGCNLLVDQGSHMLNDTHVVLAR